MAAILTGHDELFAKWAAARIPNIGTAEEFGKYVAVGVATGMKAEDRLMAVIVFHDYSQKFGTCQISAASVDPRWASRSTIRALLSIPFMQYHCNKVYLIIPHKSQRVINFAKAIGFIPEATLGEHFGPHQNAVICRMYARNYDRLYWKQEVKAA